MKLLIFTFIFIICSSFCTQIGTHSQWVTGRECYGGYAEFMNFSPKAVLVVEGELTLETANLNASGSIVVTKTGKLTIKGPLHLNGENFIENHGILICGDVEMQGSSTSITNKGAFSCNELQMSSENATIFNCGELKVKNYLNVHKGIFEGCNCSTLEVFGLNVNKANAFLGLGHIKVTGNLNLNFSLTQSPYKLCYSGNLNQPEKLGGAKLDCDFSCSDSPLPLVVGKVSTRKVAEGYEVSIPVLSAYSIKEVRVQVSLDSVTWRTVKLISPTDLEAGKTYKTIITL